MLRIVSGLICSLWLFGCVQTDQQDEENSEESTLQNTQEPSNLYEPFDLKWLEYADPLADANLAIAKDNFTLLAFSNRGLRFPGISDLEYDLETLTAACGVKVLKGTGDMLEPGQSLERRKKLREYATRYNPLVFEACQSKLSANQN